MSNMSPQEEIEYRVGCLVSQVENLKKEINEIKQSISKESKVENSEWEWWRPFEGKDYYYISTDGTIRKSIWSSLIRDEDRLKNFNVFRSEEEAKEFQHLGTYQRKWAMILKELNPKGWEPDWSQEMEYKWFPYYIGKIVKCSWNNHCQYGPSFLYTQSKEICEEAIELMGADIYKMFGVEKS